MSFISVHMREWLVLLGQHITTLCGMKRVSLPMISHELVYSLSYVYQRSTTEISIIAPICYAHLAAVRISQFMKFEDMSETSSSQGGLTSSIPCSFPETLISHTWGGGGGGGWEEAVKMINIFAP